MSDDRSPAIDRRHLIAATVGGALFGSAWGLALGQTATDPDTPTVTVVWNRAGFTALLDYHRRRVLVLDSASPEGHEHLTQLVTGFMRQRIDVLLATDTTLAALPSEFRSRWRIADVLAVDPDAAHPQIGMTGRQLEIDDVAVACHGTETDAWQRGAASRGRWYIEVRRQRSRLVVAGTAAAAGQVAPHADATTALLVFDQEVERPPVGLDGVIIAAPNTAPLFGAGSAPTDSVVRLYRDSPAQFALPGDGVVVSPD